MLEPKLRHSHVQVNDCFVHLLQYCCDGSLVKPPNTSTINTTSSSIFDTSSSTRTASSIGTPSLLRDIPQNNLIIFVPGNPGILGIYHDFLSALFRSVNGCTRRGATKTNILAIGHNNFDHPDAIKYKAEERINIEEADLNFVERSMAKKYQGEPHHIELQVLNKLIILKRLLKLDLANCKLVFVGHSIGCYIILRLLQDRALASAHKGSVFIHPALENMALTPKGSHLARLFSYRVDLLIYAAAFLVEWLLPSSVKQAIVRWRSSPEFVENSSDVAVESVGQLVCHKSLAALIEMAKSEFALVKNLNSESMIKPHASKLRLIYAINDHWVNASHKQMLKDKYSELYIEEHPNLHAFCMDPKTAMDYSIKVGMFVQDFLEPTDETNTSF